MLGKHALRSIALIISLFLSAGTVAQEDDGPGSASSDPMAENEKPADSSTKTSPKKTLPDSNAKRIELLKAQYPKNDIIDLSAQGTSFSALWKKDQSGDAFGAILIVPSPGQTANWPNTIDVIRKELPRSGWSTLSIDIDHSVSQTPSKQDDSGDANQKRVEAAINYLHQQGQYNIVLAGYGFSAGLILDYASRSDAPGMRRTIKSSQTNLKRPVRALIMISPQTPDGARLSDNLLQFPYRDMPILDITFGNHYLDTFDKDERLSNARAANLSNYVQSKSIEPTNQTKVFGKDNRLSRRIRGFLDRYAKGVEVERRR